MTLQDFNKKVIFPEGDEVILRTPRVSDAFTFSQYISELVDEDTFISSQKQSEEDEMKYIHSMLRKIEENKEIHLVGFFQDRKIASIDIFNLGVRKEHSGELQINIHKDFRGRGLGIILMEEALKIAKQQLHLKLIMLTSFSVNTHALSIYKKCGFIQYGLLPEAILYKGSYIDEILMYKSL